jgi:oligoribonuclease NrnB/cAMP/cGMP phosphodiesterase (DHH superfamily)
MSQRIRIFSHRDLDGAGSVIQLKKIYPQAYYSLHGYDTVGESIMKFISQDSDSLIFITDLRIKEELAEILNKRGNVILLDHHPGTDKLAEKYDWVRYSDEYCGTVLVYNYLRKDNEGIKDYLKFVEAVNGWDLWTWKQMDTDISLSLNRLLYLLDFDEFITRFTDNPSLEFSSMEEWLLNKEDKKIRNYVESCVKNANSFRFIMYPKDNTFGIVATHYAVVIYAENYTNEIAEHYKNVETPFDFVMIINMKSKGVSLRSIKDTVNVKEIAEEFGGGGHARAAGFVINSAYLQKINEIIITGREPIKDGTV